jgi:hypothetical protein
MGNIKDREAIKAMDASTAGEGQEFIPTDLSSELQKRFELDRKVAGLFRYLEMPTNPFELPIQGTGAKLYKVGESTGEDGTGQYKPDASTPSTGKVVFSATDLVGRVNVSYNLVQDSIVAILPMVKDDLSGAVTGGIENVLLNGDTTATHMDSDVSNAASALGAYAQEKSWKGLRKLALAGNCKTDLSTFTKATVRAMVTSMSKYGVNAEKLAFIVGPKGWNIFKGILSDLDIYTTNKTGITGAVGNFDGIQIINSEFMRENLNTAGVYDGTTITKTAIILVYRPEFVLGNHGPITIEEDKDIAYRQKQLVTCTRKDFQALHTPHSVNYPTVWLGYNIA